MATVSDRTLPEAVTGTPTAVRGYTADIVTASDYYPFGMVSRAFNSPSVNYRYGFNGKEVDNEMFGIGNELDYGMRVYDPRVGRFLSVDPITKSYPQLTPYQYASNSPIENIDIDGLEKFTAHIMRSIEGNGQPKMRSVSENTTQKQVLTAQVTCHPDKTYLKQDQIRIQKEYAALDHEGGQVAFPRSSFWTFLSGPRTMSVEEKIGESSFLSNRIIDDDGYLTDRIAPITGTPPDFGKIKGVPGMLGANFAQKKVNSKRLFSLDGQAKYSELAGSEIKTIEDLATAIVNKKVNVSDITVDFVMRNGEKVILNTRTSAALKKAGVPMDKWTGINKTGEKVPGMNGKTFDDLANEQISRNYKPGESLSTTAPD